MVVAAIVACEIGFWVVLAAGLLTRYVLRRPRAGAALLVCVPLVDLVPDVGPGGSVVVRSVTGYSRRFAPDELDGVLLAHSMSGRPLLTELGAPLRLVVPDRRGFWWVKWVDAVEVDDLPAWTQPAFPLQ